MQNKTKHDKPPSKFNTLPLDILISLMDYLHPLDLIALRKTCRALYDASHQRIVWIKALTDVCVANDVFLPTFQFDRLTTEDLSRAATTPSRWLAFVKRRYRQQAGKSVRDGMLLKPTSNAINLDLLPNDDVQGVFLVPGGRFAVILTLHSLQLWDLEPSQLGGVGGSANSREKGRPVASLGMNQQYNITFSVQATKDGMGLRVAVPSYPMDTAANSRKQIAVYEIFPLEAQPTINEIALLGIDSTAPTIAPRLAGNWVVFLEGRIVKVWDFVNDLWAEWNTQKDFFNNIFTMSDSVLMLNHEETVMWKVPALKPLDQEPTPTTAENVATFPSLLRRGTKRAHWGQLSDWYCNKREYILDIFSKASPGSETFVVSRYKMASRMPPSQPSTSTVRIPDEPCLVFQRELPFSLDISNPALQYRCCEDDLVGCSISKDGLLEYVSVSGKRPDSFAHVAMKLKHEMDSVADYSVCPLSGKICYATDENELEVADLF